MNAFEELLSGFDLRSLGKSQNILSQIRDQKSFDKLFKFLFHSDRLVVMRAADTIEKISLTHPSYLQKHKQEILSLSKKPGGIELKWHIALILPRLNLGGKELKEAWKLLVLWAKDKNESKIVRVNAIQGLSEFAMTNKNFETELTGLFDELEKERIPSIKARIRKLRRNLEYQKW